jgi:hypothetical protein
MDNPYHLFIETQTDNLSRFMRFVSANYAQYFNKKTKRPSHLWQNRYKSRYVTSERYLYTLIRYIESNPIVLKQDYPKRWESILLLWLILFLIQRISIFAQKNPYYLETEDGYSQIEIANYLRLSKSAVSLIIKKLGSGDLTAGM